MAEALSSEFTSRMLADAGRRCPSVSDRGADNNGRNLASVADFGQHWPAMAGSAAAEEMVESRGVEPLLPRTVTHDGDSTEPAAEDPDPANPPAGIRSAVVAGIEPAQPDAASNGGDDGIERFIPGVRAQVTASGTGSYGSPREVRRDEDLLWWERDQERPRRAALSMSAAEWELLRDRLGDSRPPLFWDPELDQYRPLSVGEIVHVDDLLGVVDDPYPAQVIARDPGGDCRLVVYLIVAAGLAVIGLVVLFSSGVFG